MLLGVHHIAVNVRDFDRMFRFYTDGLGLAPIGAPTRWKDEPLLDIAVDVPGTAARHAMLNAGTCYLELFEYTAPLAEAKEPLRPHDRGYTHFCMESDDIDADVARLKTCGMSFTGRAAVNFGNGSSTIYGYDPEGNIIEIQQLNRESRFWIGLVNDKVAAHL